MTWWENAVGYEVYIRSFADSNGDGIGDFDGLTARLDYLAELGIDVVWVTPFYPSPQADFGYDVADYTAIDPDYGDMEAFDRFHTRTEELGLKVMIDLVPNHTSSAHEWFQKALADPSSPERDFYIFRPPAIDGGPPNNWRSHFGGSAWTIDEQSGEYYLHLFHRDQPDLNWSNPAVRDHFDAILGFWIDRGVDGFRIDVAHALMKDEELRDNPQILPLPDDASPNQAMAAFEHIHDHSQDSSKEIFARWKALPRGDETFLLGEVYVLDVEKSSSYMGIGGLDLCLFFGLNRRQWDAVAFVEEVRSWSLSSENGFAWTISSHDEKRPVTRFGGGDLGRARALSIWTLFCSLPGVPFAYQGEELGLEDGHVDPQHIQDPVGLVAYHESRDFSRTPMAWDATDNNGFSSGEPWIICRPRPAEDTVAHQQADPGSFLHFFKELLAVRKQLGQQRGGEVEWLPAPSGVALVLTGTVATVANLTDEPAEVELPAGEWTVEFDTTRRKPESQSGTVTVAPASARVYSAT